MVWYLVISVVKSSKTLDEMEGKLILEKRLEWEEKKSCGYRQIRATGGMQAICLVGDGLKYSKNKPRQSQ